MIFITGLAQLSSISRRAVHSSIIMARFIDLIFIIIVIVVKLRVGPLR